MLALAGEQAGKPVPTRLSWLYTTGALALFFFALQFFTGCLLLTLYVPEETLAFKSVQTIEYHARLGWLIRQMHSWGASFIIVVLVLHMLKVVWYGSYKRPREFTWFVGMLLLGVSMLFCFSGYLLPWNQLAFWATRVGLGAVDSFPVIGSTLKELICGGEDVSGATLGRFFALHVVILPLLLLALVGYHLALITWKGISPKTTVTDEIELGNKAALAKGGSEPFFPRQVYRDLIACSLGFALLVTFATWWPWHLGEPADRFGTPDGIKPEWYFLPMYQFLKYFDDNLYSALPFLRSWGVDPAFLGVLTINGVALVLFLLPVIDRGKERKITRRPIFAVLAFLLFLGVFGMGFLGYISETTRWGYHFSSKGYPERVEEPGKEAAGEGQAGEEAGSAGDDPGKDGSEEGGGGGPAEEEESQEEAPEDEAIVTPGLRQDGLPDGGTCGSCHKHEKPLEKWTESVHHAAGVQCVDCHGGIDTAPPEQFLLALELLFEADEEASKEPEEEEEEAKPENSGKDAKSTEEESEKEKVEEEPAKEKESGAEDGASKEKKDVEEPAEKDKPAKDTPEKDKPAEDTPVKDKPAEDKPAGQEAEGAAPKAGKPADAEAAGKPEEGEPAEDESGKKEEEPEEEKEPPKPRLEIKWHRSIETPEDKRLFLYSHQGMLVDSRGRPDRPDDEDPELAGKLCGSCHVEVLEHYLAARAPASGEKEDSDSEGEESVTAHTKVCWDCHENHAVLKPGDFLWEDDGYTDEDDELTAPFQQIKADLDVLDAELSSARLKLLDLEKSGYPVDGKVAEKERFEELVSKARQIRPAVHRLDPAVIQKQKAGISTALAALSEEMAQRQAGRASAEKSVVVWAWIVAAIFSLLCIVKLVTIPDGELAAGAVSDKPRKSTRAKKGKAAGAGSRRKSSKGSGKKKSSKSRDVSDFQNERDALLDPLDSDDEK
jgi:quinol-cytochrome oxidoreductase complex cytochrome b subunit